MTTRSLQEFTTLEILWAFIKIYISNMCFQIWKLSCYPLKKKKKHQKFLKQSFNERSDHLVPAMDAMF